MITLPLCPAPIIERIALGIIVVVGIVGLAISARKSGNIM